MTRCCAHIGFTQSYVWRSGGDDPRCLRRAIRVFSSGDGYCAAHLAVLLRDHDRIVKRILTIPPRDIVG